MYVIKCIYLIIKTFVYIISLLKVQNLLDTLQSK